MNNLPLKKLKLDTWLLTQLQRAPEPGLTLAELQEQWLAYAPHEGKLGRTSMTRHRKSIADYFGIVIDSPDRLHYRIANPEALCLDTLANDLLASLQEYHFVDQFRDLGDAIQPAQTWNGMEYLSTIGEALRQHLVLSVCYQKFVDDKPYNCLVRPYCLKAWDGRWYLLAERSKTSPEGDSPFEIRMFALDRMSHLRLTDSPFVPNPAINPSTYFDDAFGIWVDPDNYPVADICVQLPDKFIPFWRTKPLHHSQRESTTHRGLFFFHLSPTPDFVSELKRWDAQITKLTNREADERIQ